MDSLLFPSGKFEWNFAAMLQGSSPTFFVPLEMVSWKMVWLDPIISKVKTGGKALKRKTGRTCLKDQIRFHLPFRQVFFFFYATKVWNTFRGHRT